MIKDLIPYLLILKAKRLARTTIEVATPLLLLAILFVSLGIRMNQKTEAINDDKDREINYLFSTMVKTQIAPDMEMTIAHADLELRHGVSLIMERQEIDTDFLNFDSIWNDSLELNKLKHFADTITGCDRVILFLKSSKEDHYVKGFTMPWTNTPLCVVVYGLGRKPSYCTVLHEIGHSYLLHHEQDENNFMSSGSSRVEFNPDQIRHIQTLSKRTD